jgi:hypothetical protein
MDNDENPTHWHVCVFAAGAYAFICAGAAAGCQQGCGCVLAAGPPGHETPPVYLH